MSSFAMLNRRKGNERRVRDIGAGLEHRQMDARRHSSNHYFLVLGNGGLDGFSVACLIALVVIVAFVTLSL